MNQLKDIKNHILSVLNGGDILFIVPPFTSNSPSIAPHILQAIAREKSYDADILYLNSLLASISKIGLEFSEKLGLLNLFQNWGMLNERLFARKAYGLPPLGKSPEPCSNQAMSRNEIIEHQRRIAIETEQVDLKKLLEIEKICNSFVDEAVEALASLPYKIIGCTARMGQVNCSIAVINRIKRICPGVITIIGGANCQGEMAEGVASLSDAVDYVFSGESEYSFSEFLDNFSMGQLPSERIIHEKLLDNLDILPPLDYDCYFRQLKQFFGDNPPEINYVWYETSKGCWWAKKKKCNFCSRSNFRKKFREKSPQKVINDLSLIKKRYPNMGVGMSDDIMPYSYFHELLPILAEKNDYPDIDLYNVKANLKLEDLLKLKKARINLIIPGIESLSPALLKLLNKGVTARNNLLLLRNARCIGLSLLWFMLWGIPGDKAVCYEEVLKILPIIRHLQPPQELNSIKLERFSNYFENPLNYNIKNLRPWEAYKVIYPEWADISKLAFTFDGEYPCEAYEHPELIRDILDELVVWKKTWKNSTLAMFPFDDYYFILDNRKPEKGQKHILEYSQAKEIMKYAIYNGSENQDWAVKQELGVVVESWYVPLVTASPQLLLEFEKQ